MNSLFYATVAALCGCAPVTMPMANPLVPPPAPTAKGTSPGLDKLLKTVVNERCNAGVDAAFDYLADRIPPSGLPGEDPAYIDAYWTCFGDTVRDIERVNARNAASVPPAKETSVGRSEPEDYQRYEPEDYSTYTGSASRGYEWEDHSRYTGSASRGYEPLYFPIYTSPRYDEGPDYYNQWQTQQLLQDIRGQLNRQAYEAYRPQSNPAWDRMQLNSIIEGLRLRQ